MIVVDGSVWIDYFNGRDAPETDALDAWLGQEIIIVGDITITEVPQGFGATRISGGPSSCLNRSSFARCSRLGPKGPG